MNNLIISLIISFWLIVIAVFSIQNISLVKLQFLNFQSISISLGVLITFCLAGGFLLGSLFPLFFASKKPQIPTRNKQKNRPKENEFKRDWEEEDPIFDWE
jgi:uncharacterized integral membrane protein